MTAFWIGIIIGLVLGACIGVVTAALLRANDYRDTDHAGNTP